MADFDSPPFDLGALMKQAQALQTKLKHLLPQVARLDLAHDLAALRGAQAELRAVPDRLHELIGDGDAVMEIE